MHGDGPTRLVAALSGRALAAAARRAGERAVVLDLFADLDTRRHAAGWQQLPPGPDGFDHDALLTAVAAWRRRVGGLVYGSGFDGDLPLLRALADLVPVIGNPPDTVAAVKDPLAFAALLARLGIPHPETRAEGAGIAGWLRKRRGGSGGAHVAPAEAAPWAPGTYLQRRHAGRPVSALFLADGKRAVVLGCSEQWADATATAPFRYGGCAGPLALAPALSEAVAGACDAIARATGLVGLNSLDMLVAEGAFTVIELNPRPGATLDVFDRPVLPLWRLHCAAVAGRLPPVRSLPHLETRRAAAILYAPQRVAIARDLTWPAWTADRGPPGTVIEPGMPICTIRAAGPEGSSLRAILASRVAAMQARLGLSGTVPRLGDRHVA